MDTLADYVANLLDGRCDPAIADQVVAVVAVLEDPRRQAKDDIEIELRLSDLETEVYEFLLNIQRRLGDES